MRVLMTGGGTAGHINPALAIADKIRVEQPDAQFLFVGATGRMETRLVPAAGYDLKTVTVQGFQRKLSLKNIGRNCAAAYHALTASREARAILKEFQPDVAIGTGGYVSGPVLREAAKMGIPTLVHESNMYPGVTTKMLAGSARILIAAEEAKRHLPEGCRVTVTGNPLRAGFRSMDRATARRELGLDDRPLILSYGGSLGAATVNRVMAAVLERSAATGGFQHIHATGTAHWAAMRALLKEKNVPLDGGIVLREYIDDMPRCLAAADLVICRCGAMTMSELPMAGKPSILIPSPNVAENHQYYNAMSLADRGAAICIEEKDLTADGLWEAIRSTAGDPDVLRRMAEAARGAAVYDAADRVYAAVMQEIADHRDRKTAAR